MNFILTLSAWTLQISGAICRLQLKPLSASSKCMGCMSAWILCHPLPSSTIVLVQQAGLWSEQVKAHSHSCSLAVTQRPRKESFPFLCTVGPQSNSMDFGNTQTQVQIPALPLSHCRTLRKLLHLSETEPPHL